VSLLGETNSEDEKLLRIKSERIFFKKLSGCMEAPLIFWSYNRRVPFSPTTSLPFLSPPSQLLTKSKSCGYDVDVVVVMRRSPSGHPYHLVLQLRFCFSCHRCVFVTGQLGLEKPIRVCFGWNRRHLWWWLLEKPIRVCFGWNCRIFGWNCCRLWWWWIPPSTSVRF